MLVLSRKPGESIRIADNIEITVIDIGGGRVKLGISAPRDVHIIRSELIVTHDEFAHAWDATEKWDLETAHACT